MNRYSLGGIKEFVSKIWLTLKKYQMKEPWKNPWENDTIIGDILGIVIIFLIGYMAFVMF
jgi:hypothetical protein